MGEHKTNHAADELQWIPVILDGESGTVHVFCRDNTQAIAAVQVATERGLTARRFRAAADAPAPIEIRVSDERTVEIPTCSMFDLVYGRDQ